MGELQPGEEVATADGGRSHLVAKERRGAGPEYVYNLEVWRDHNFHVGAQGVLVHNTYWDKIVQYGKGSGARFQKAIDHLWENHNPFSKVKGKSYFRNDLDTKEKIKKYVTDAQKTENHSALVLKELKIMKIV